MKTSLTPNMKANNIINFVLAIFFIFSGMSCQEKFNAAKWRTKGVDWYMTDFRERMVEDLMNSESLPGLDTVEVIQLLGKPDVSDFPEFKYLIREKYGWDIDSDYIKYLSLKFDTSGRVTKCIVEEIK